MRRFCGMVADCHKPVATSEMGTPSKVIPSDPGPVKPVFSPAQPCWMPFNCIVYFVAPVCPYPITLAPGVKAIICAPPATGPAASSCLRSKTRMDWLESSTSVRVGMGLAPGTTVPRTTTDCDKVAIDILALTTADCSVDSETCCVNALKPDFSTVTKYRSGSRLLTRNWPSTPVLVRATAPEVRLLTETLAPAIAAPDSSTAFPVMVPTPWAWVISVQPTTRRQTPIRFRIIAPSSRTDLEMDCRKDASDSPPHQ